MSETEQEAAEPPVEEQEEPSDDPETEADEEAEDAETEQGEPQEPPEEPQPEGMSEKEMEATRKKLDNENARHRGRISDLIGEEALLLEPCPLCSGFADGYRFPIVPPDDVIEQVRVAIGMPDLSNYQQAKDAAQCPDCVGLGVVLSGSLVAENAAINCKTCNGSGYVMLSPAGEITGPTVMTNGAPLQELPAGVNPDDPAVRELRARGFTVFPPVNIGTPA
jgi:hypothetical protein